MRSQNPSHNRNKSRLPLALAALVAVFALATTAGAAPRFGATGGSGGKIGPIGGLTGITGKHGGGKTGAGSGNLGGGRVSGGGNTGGGGGRVSGGGGNDGRGHPPRPHGKPPILTTFPTAVPVIGTATTGIAGPALGTGGGGGGGGSPSGVTRGGYLGVPPVGETRYVRDEVLVQLAAEVPDTVRDALVRQLRLTQVESFTSNGVAMSRLKIPDGRPVPEVIRSLQGLVLAAQPNYLYHLQEQPVAKERQSGAAADDKGENWQYALAKLRLPQAHELAKGGQVLIAIIDSAVDAAHPELAGMVAESFDALDTDEPPHSHGTGIAGAIVAHSRLMGAAPQARILAARAFSAKTRTAEATTYSINRGIDWAMSRGARIINMSFAGPRDPAIERRIGEARKHGIVLIAAAGNGGPKASEAYPAAYPGVIAVTATDIDDKLFSGANRGRYIAVAAPGVDLLLPAPDATYQVTTGTSFAAAEVSGIVALMLERRPDLGPDGIHKALIATARDLGPKGFDIQYGAGLVDAYQAVQSLQPTIVTTGARLR
jgi:Subtilase family/Fervidolysin N-terminal prodomain